MRSLDGFRSSRSKARTANAATRLRWTSSCLAIMLLPLHSPLSVRQENVWKMRTGGEGRSAGHQRLRHPVRL